MKTNIKKQKNMSFIIKIRNVRKKISYGYSFFCLLAKKKNLFKYKGILPEIFYFMKACYFII